MKQIGTELHSQVVKDSQPMGRAYLCMVCGYTHTASDWYYRDARDGSRAYACEKKLNAVLHRSQRQSVIAIGD